MLSLDASIPFLFGVDGGMWNWILSISDLALSWLFCMSIHYLSLVMKKPVFTLFEQQRRRSACTSTQSDQHLCCSLLSSEIPVVSISEISSLYLLLWLGRPVCVLPDRKSRIQVFLWRGSFVSYLFNFTAAWIYIYFDWIQITAINILLYFLSNWTG